MILAKSLMEFLIMVDVFFNISPQTGNLLSRLISKIKSTNQLNSFANRVIHFWKKFPNSIKNNVENFKIKLVYHWKMVRKKI